MYPRCLSMPSMLCCSCCRGAFGPAEYLTYLRFSIFRFFLAPSHLEKTLKNRISCFALHWYIVLHVCTELSADVVVLWRHSVEPKDLAEDVRNYVFGVGGLSLLINARGSTFKNSKRKTQKIKRSRCRLALQRCFVFRDPTGRERARPAS